MKRTFFTFVLACLFALPSFAQEAEEKPAPAPVPADGKPAEAAAEDEVVDDTEDVIFERLVGLYFEGRGGIFFTVGGARGYSNGQPFFGFELGYDITERLSIQFGYASGYQAANPLKYPEECGGGPNCNAYHLDFGLTFFNLSADYDIFHGRRWALEGRLGYGFVIIDPSARPSQGAIDFDLFGGIRFEYYTLLKHFTISFEYDFYYISEEFWIVSGGGIPAMSVTVSILYNF